MELFRAEKIDTMDDQSTKVCRFCAQKLTLVRVIVDPDSGDVFHMFECKCGDRIWLD
jgi:hypothetical protein